MLEVEAGSKFVLQVGALQRSRGCGGSQAGQTGHADVGQGRGHGHNRVQASVPRKIQVDVDRVLPGFLLWVCSKYKP